MSDRTYGKIWLWGGLILSIGSIITYGYTQSWFTGVEVDAHYYSVYGIIGFGIPFFIFTILIGYFSIRSPSEKWYCRLPFVSDRLDPETVEAKLLQRILITFFIIVPLIVAIHCPKKFLEGTVKIEDKEGSTIGSLVRLEHLTSYVPIHKAFLRNVHDKYKYADTSMDYYPFWGAWMLTLTGATSSLSGLFLLAIVLIPKEKNILSLGLSNYILSRKYKLGKFKVPPNFELKADSRSFNNRANFSYDVFICHSTADKKVIANMVKGLVREGFKVWYDDFHIKPGQVLTDEINLGILSSRYGMVILSNSFFEKKWTKLELEFLMDIEKKAGEIIIPVWLNIDEDKIREYSDKLADIYSYQFDQQLLPKLIEKLRK